MQYKTRGNSNPQGKPRVYFTGHPADVKLYFKSITDAILEIHNCTVFYDEDPERPEDAENFISDLDRIQMIVLVVTSRYVYGDTFAHNTVFQHAMERHIPVLPILEERGIEGDFNRKCGDLQYLDPNARDDTAISFEEKLKRFLDSVLVGDELAAKVRAAFDAYIFLSYRKKDRRYAQQLMRLIHQNPFCRDIAIWYDEFLVPGESFNNAIRKAMEKSELFALVVTPNLLENPNYIMSTEYPAAREADMPVLPAMLVPTDGRELAARYENIPKPIDPTKKEVLSAALATVAAPENDNEPQHIFFIGLAYLGGIDVEVNYELAKHLITWAAEAGLPEAIEKLVSMYRTGEGVARDYYTAIHWQEKLVKAHRAAYEAARAEEEGRQWFNALLHLGDFWYELWQLTQAGKVYYDMLEAGRILNKDYHDERVLSLSYNRLGKISQARGDLDMAKAFYEENLSVSERLAVETGTAEAWRRLSFSYNDLGEISRVKSELAEARTFYEKGLSIREQLASLSGTVATLRDLSTSYNNLGEIIRAQGDLDGAKALHKKCLAIRDQLAVETGTVEALWDLSFSYNNLGNISHAQGDLTEAKAFYEKGLAICEQFVSKMGTVAARRDLAVIYSNLGDIIHEQRDLETARVFHEKCLAIRERLVSETGTVEARQDLAATYNNLGAISHGQGDLAGAKACYEKSLAIFERLAEETGAVQVRVGLAVSYSNLGEISRVQGDLAGAKACYEKGLTIYEQLAEETGTVQARLGLSSNYERLGVINQAHGDLAGARACYEKGLAISERLMSETGYVEVRRNVFVSYGGLGNISREQGDLAEAKTFYEKSLAICEQLAEETDAVEDWRGVSISYDNLGDISLLQEDLGGAKTFYEKSLAIRKRLASEIKTIEADDDLAISYYKMFGAANTAEEEQEYLRKAETIWTRLAAQCPDVPKYAERLDLVRKYIR